MPGKGFFTKVSGLNSRVMSGVTCVALAALLTGACQTAKPGTDSYCFQVETVCQWDCGWCQESDPVVNQCKKLCEKEKWECLRKLGR